MKRTLLYIVAGLSILSATVSSCDTDYDLDIPDGWDTNKGDESNVTVDTLIGIDASMYDKARIFPGLADTLREVHIDTVLHLDLSKIYVEREAYHFTSPVIGNRGENMPQPIYSTGCYAGAGELIKIEVPAGSPYGLSVQIGAQTDDLSKTSSYFREPIVYTRKSLSPGTNYMRFPLGGYIWVIREPKAKGPADFQLTIKNAYRAPDFICGVTNPDDWAKVIQCSTVPWLEIRSKRIAISIDRERVSQFIQADSKFAQNLGTTLSNWDKLIENTYEAMGIAVEDENPVNAMPAFPQRFIFDVQINVNGENVLLHNNNVQGISMVKTTRLYNELIGTSTVNNADFFSIYNSLFDRYRLVHDSDSPDWESAVKRVPAYRHAESVYRSGAISAFPALSCNFDKIVKNALTYADKDMSKDFTHDKWLEDTKIGSPTFAHHIVMLGQLGNYDVLKDLPAWSGLFSWRKAVRDGKALFGNGDSESSLFRALCDYYKENLTPFYENWGVVLSDIDREYAAQYPLVGKEIWKIDLLAKTNLFAKVGNYDKSKFHYRHNRNNWTIYAADSAYVHDNFDKEYSDSKNFRRPENLLDGSRSTAWRSYLAKDGDTPYPLPYYIVIDMQKEQDVDGFYFINGNISKFTIQTTDASGFNLYDSSVQWRTLKTVSQSEGFHANEQYFDFGSRVNARYLRIVITELNLSHPKATATQDEIDKFYRLHKNRTQEFYEFGTYYYQK